MREYYNSSNKSLKQRLGASKEKKSILSRIGSSTRSADHSGISNSLKNRLNKGKNEKKPILRRLAPNPVITRAKSSFGQNKHLFARAIAETTSVDRPVRSSSLRLRSNKNREIEDRPVNFRIPNGTIVKGLRSDSILLQKKRSETAKTSPTKKYPNSRIKLASRSQPQDLGSRRNRPLRALPSRENLMRSGQSKGRLFESGNVSMSTNRGLTINIKNEQNRRRLEALPRIMIRNELPSSDEEYMDDEPLPARPNPYKLDFRKMTVQQYVPPRRLEMQTRQMELQPYLQPVMSKVVVMQPDVVPVSQPKLHKQVLDSEVQSEIATLQGRPWNNVAGPGPGVKSFKMIPVITKKSLTDRFRQDKVKK